MYPNPQDVLPLPPHPNMEQYRKRAKDLAVACRTGEPAIATWATRWITTLMELQPESSRAPSTRDAEELAGALARFASERLLRADCALSEAQLVIARAHGFASWPRLRSHVADLSSSTSAISTFERAADAIVTGNVPALEQLIEQDPALVRTQSTREHHATLLHYVSANGVENFRQRTPANVVTIAHRLLDAGADVNAEADVYGGGATTLGLVVTSAHPRQAGVQSALADLLLDRGARMARGIVRSCLMNGCPEAATQLADRGATLDFVEACGIGRMDLVTRRLQFVGTIPTDDAAAAMVIAAWYDQRHVIGLLLDSGIDAGVQARGDKRTALHIAAFTGNTALVQLLVERGAPVNATDDTYRTPPLAWALHAWLVERPKDGDAFRAVIRLLLDAGSVVEPRWLGDGRLRAVPELWEALSQRAGGSAGAG